MKLTKRGPLRRAAGSALKALPLSKVYQLIEPGPVVLLTTAHRGRVNVMTMSWHMMVDFVTASEGPGIDPCITRIIGYFVANRCFADANAL